MQIPDYPGNNRKANDHPKDDIPDKEIKKVVKGKVTTQKKSIGEKFADTFLAEDVDSVKVYFWQDLFVPTVKKLVADGISDAVHMLFLGSPARKTGTPTSSISYGGRTSYTPYNNLGSTSVVNRQTTYDYNNVVVETRADAEEVLISLDEIVSRYGMASIADFYELTGINGSYTDNKYGWTDVRGALPVRAPNGWLIKMPKAQPLK